MSIPETTARALAEAHAVVLLDAYGVLVTGHGVIPGAPEFIRDLDAAGRAYLVLTNDASKHPTTAVKRYAAWGLMLDASRIITSGSLLAPHFAQEGLQGARTMVMGPPDAEAYAREAGAEVVPLTSVDADVLVVADEAGYPFLETLDHVLSVVLYRAERGEPMRLVLPNPDLIYPKRKGAGPGPDAASGARSGPTARGDGWDGSAGPGPERMEFGIAAGSIARVLEDALQLRHPGQEGLRFARLGKPYRAIYEAALTRTGTMDMVMIGDTLATDIRGARGFGLAAGLATWGLTGPLPADLPESERPTHLVRSF